MSEPLLLLGDYSLGMKQDIPRNQMPRGAVWGLVDYIPRVLGAPIRKRGPWAWGSPLTGGGGYAISVGWAPYLAGSQLVKVNSSGALYRVTSDSAETLIGTLGVYPYTPVFYRDKLFYGEYGLALSSYNGSAIATVAAAPLARHLIAYKDRLVVSRGKVGATDYPQRTWFSAAGDPFTWDLTNSYIEHTFPVTASVALRSMILVFGDERAERIVGSTPPTALDLGDMERGPAFEVGCVDARSLATYGELVIWANQEGIWRTDGALPENLARSGGLRRYWLDLMSTWQVGWQLSGGIIADNYVVSVLDHNGVFLDCLMLDLGTLSWSRHSNIRATMMAQAGAADELYFARRADPRLGRLAPLFRPSLALGADADATVILPVLETPYQQGQAGIKRWIELFANYLLDGSGVGTSPSFEVGVILEPEDLTYTSIGALSQKTATGRDALPIRYDSPGLALKMTQVLASSDTRLFDLSANVQPMEGSRVR